MSRNKTGKKLTKEALQTLVNKGFRYVLVIGYSLDRRQEHIQMNHFILVPVRELPREQGEMEIYAPIDSEILLEWADSSNKDVNAYIEFRKDHY